MKTNPSTAVILVTLICLGGWGVWKIISQNNQNAPTPHEVQAHKETSIEPSPERQHSNNNHSNENTFTELVRLNESLLESGQFERAVDLVNDQYSELSSDQLLVLKRQFIQQGITYSDSAQHAKAQRLYRSLTTLFDDVDVWDLLSNELVKLQDWSSALDALLHSSLLENRSDVLIKKRSSLASIAAQLKQNHLAKKEYARVQQLYQALYDAHPGYSLFQLELALAQLNLNDLNNAKALLNAIQYDPEIGAAAQQQLELIAQQEQSRKQPPVTQAPQTTQAKTGVIVPLTRAGNSFLVKSKINGKQTALLLDTGASITALAPDVIRQLNLVATGDVIQLSTANGVTQSPLFLAKRIQLGSITVQNLIIAEIELGNTSRFKGLLGTDLLNKISQDYVIDNKNNQLIFESSSR